jgi:hypothetical protein
VKLAVDVFTDDPDRAEFRIRLTSRVKRMMFLDTIVDTPELRELHDFVMAELSSWVEGEVASVVVTD